MTLCLLSQSSPYSATFSKPRLSQLALQSSTRCSVSVQLSRTYWELALGWRQFRTCLSSKGLVKLHSIIIQQTEITQIHFSFSFPLTLTWSPRPSWQSSAMATPMASIKHSQHPESTPHIPEINKASNWHVYTQITLFYMHIHTSILWMQKCMHLLYTFVVYKYQQ